MARVLYESHMHTPLCRHATGEPEEYAAVAESVGFKGIIVTCHNPLPDGLAQSSRMYLDQWSEYIDIVDRARDNFQGRIDIRLGLEADYLPGLEGFLEEQLGSAEFNHVLGSVHPQLTEYRERYFHGDIVAFQRQYFEHLALAAESGFFDTLAHPDLVKNMYPEDWKPERVRATVIRSLDRIAACGTAMELNTSGMFKAISEMNPGLTMLAAMCEREIPVVIGADAHVPERVGDGYASAFDMLESVGYSSVSIFLSRRRTEIPIQIARESLLQPVIRG